MRNKTFENEFFTARLVMGGAKIQYWYLFHKEYGECIGSLRASKHEDGIIDFSLEKATSYELQKLIEIAREIEMYNNNREE